MLGKCVWYTKRAHSVDKIRTGLENFMIFSVLHYVAYRFLQSTTFPLTYSNIYKYTTIMLMLIPGGLRYILIIIGKIEQKENIKEKNKQIIRTLIAWSFAIPFIYVGWKNNYKVLIYMPILVMCTYDFEPERIIKWFIITIGLLLAATIICCLLGCINNIAFVQNRNRITYGASYGICNTTDFAAYLLFILLFIWCYINKVNNRNKLLLIFSFALVSVGAYYLTGSRTTVICCLISIVFIISDYFMEKFRSRVKKLCSLIDNAIVFVFPMMIILFGVALYLYAEGNKTIQQIDSLFSSRISDTFAVYKKYGIHLFGARFDMHGYGGSIIHDWRGYDFLDSSYFYILIRYGIIIFSIFSFLWIWISKKAIKSGRRNIALAMAVMAFYALSESHIQEINYNILVAMPFCAFANFSDKNTEWNKIHDKTIGRNCFILVGLLTSVVILGPRVLSVFRSIVSINNWNYGIKTLWPFILSILLVILLVVFWCLLSRLLLFKEKKVIIYLSILVFTFLGSGYIVNNQIDKALANWDQELSNEEAVIRLIQKEASQPIYVMDRPELYQRRFGNLSGVLLTSEDLCREQKGTIITDKNREVLLIPYNGGKYLQFSEHSGIYSFDKNVINGLEKLGYKWNDYYYSERVCNLDDLAFMNNLQVCEEGLKLEGKSKSINVNHLLDQFAGKYEVSYKLSIPNSQRDKQKVCALKILGYKDKELICQKDIYSYQFDEEGNCSIILSYSITDIPKMEYLIEACDGVTLYVEKIAWRRVS